MGILMLVFPPTISQATAGGNESLGELRFLSPTDATSDCIGDPRTPLCALETFLACTARVEPKLCLRVGVDDYSFQGKPRLLAKNYYIVSTHIIREEDITEDLKGTDWMVAGNVKITILEPEFRMPWCQDGCKTSYFLGPTDNGWHLISYAVWGVP